MKVRTLLILGALGNVAILAAIMVVFLVTANRNAVKLDSLVQGDMPELVGLNEALAQGARCSIATRNVVINPLDTKTRENFKEAAKQMDAAFDEAIAANADDPAMKANIEKIKQLGQNYRTQAWDIQEQAVAGGQQQAMALLKEKELPLWRDFRGQVSEQIKQGKLNFKKTSGDMVGTMRTSTRIVLALCLLGVLMIAGSSLVMIRNIYRQLGGEPAEVSRIAQGIADGNLALPLQQGQSGIYGAMSIMATDLRRVMEIISRSSQEVSTAAIELNANAQQAASATHEVVEQASTVATASEEMASTSSDIARNCHHAAESSALASSTAKTGAEIVRNTLENMQTISEKVRRSATVVEQLGARSDQIGAIVATIEDIADQTNLLALNAAIEAARAGEQGRGFAVVADEVRALAERTTKATREIGEMIKSVQNETKSAVGIMNEGVQDMQRGTQEAGQSGEAIAGILIQIDQVTTQINQIATAAEEQTATTHEITMNIQQISDVVTHSARGAEEISLAAQQLQRLSVELQEMLDKFRLA